MPRTLAMALLMTLALLLGACGGSGNGSAHARASVGPQAQASVGPHARAYAVGAKGSTVRVVAAGDIACPTEYRTSAKACQQAATAALALRLHPNLVLPLGDEQYENATPAQFAESYAKSWGRLLSLTRPTIGNHEYQTPGAAGYYGYFRGRQPGPPGYYRVRAGSWQIYILNSNCDKVNCGREAHWLNHQMRHHRARCSLMTMHHPRYSSGSEHGDDPTMIPFWRVALRHHNDLVLAGHEHDYERFVRMGPRGHIRPRRGMIEIVVGTGGRNFNPFGTRKLGSVYFQDSSFGVLQLDLRPRRYTWAFHTIDGRVLDSGSRRCL